MKRIKLTTISNINNIIQYDYEADKELEKFLNLDNKLKIEYSTDIKDVPYEILVIPFITGILPMIYLENITVQVDKIDKDFYESFDRIREGYKKMLPQGNWRGKIEAKEIIENKKNTNTQKSSLFYSAGVNSMDSLITHLEERPELILVWGSDILQNNEKSWNTAKKITQSVADEFELETNYISSNFRFYINENALTTKYRKLLPVSWWYDVQYGAALLGHVAPIAYKKGLTAHYIASSYTIHDKNVICASCPTLDEQMKFCGCNIVHDGFEKTRIEKVENICKFSEQQSNKLKLRVCCTERQEEINCCRCEKCYRTIAEIIACKKDPKDFGFEISNEGIREIEKFLENQELQETSIRHWKEIQSTMLSDKDYFENLDYINWILNFNFDKINKIDFKREKWNKNGEKIILNSITGMDEDTAIKVDHVYKSFTVYYDRANTLKERVLFFSRNKRKEKREILNDINIKIKKGETVGLIGVNGSGKSTLLKLMTKIIYPNKGKIGTNGKLTSLLELGAGFHPDFSGRENIYFNASIFGLTKKEIDDRVEKIIEFSELKDFIDNPVRTYSSGMYMRLAFSVAINVDAEILLIDEILSVGDQHFQEKCFAKMRELKKEGKTMVFVTHSMGSVKELCDRAIWLHQGRVKMDGDSKIVVDRYLEETR